MKTTPIILLGASLLLIAGCGEEQETFSRYPSVSIPEYGAEDYIRDLSDPNPELVYNAICNLGGQASSFSKTLCATNAEPNSKKYKIAEKAYREVCDKFESEDPLTVAASLRFLQLFSKKYNPKEELVGIACRVESDNPQVLFEQAALLKTLAKKDTKLPESLLRRLQDSSSWIVTRTTYGLIGKLKDEPLRSELVQRYQETEDEREQLMLTRALRQKLKPGEARLFEEKTFATESPKIRHATVSALMQNIECPGVKQWLLNHYSQFSNKEKASMFEECDDVDLMCYFVAQGYTPDDEFLSCLLQALHDEEESDERAEMLRVEQALMAAPQLAERWQAMKAEAEQERLRMDALHEEMAPVSHEFLEQARVILTRHGKTASEIDTTIKRINKTLAPLTGE